jgi:hypothetical protein
MTEYRVMELLHEIKTMIIGNQIQDKWMDINKASKYCDVSCATLRRNVKANKLVASQETGKMLFKKSELEQWLNG